MNSYVHVLLTVFAPVTSCLATSLFALLYKAIITEFGLLSVLFSFDHCFVTFILVVSGVCVLVTTIVVIFSSITNSVSYDTWYFSEFSVVSSTEYFISSPFAYFVKPVNSYSHFPSSFGVISTGSPTFAFSSPIVDCSCTVMLSGLIPSWLLLSFHTFVTFAVVVSGVCVFVIVNVSSLYVV